MLPHLIMLYLQGFQMDLVSYDLGDSGNNMSLKKLINAKNMFNGATSFNTQVLNMFFGSLLYIQNAEGMFMGCTRLTNSNNRINWNL